MGCTCSRTVDDELAIDPKASSLSKADLRKLSRSVLGRRLRKLGSAPSEGDGLAYSELVDTVLLWNLINKLRVTNPFDRPRVLDVLRTVALSKRVVDRALVAFNVPLEQRKNVSEKGACELLCQKLAGLANIQDATFGDDDDLFLDDAETFNAARAARNSGTMASSAVPQPSARSTLKAAKKIPATVPVASAEGIVAGTTQSALDLKIQQAECRDNAGSEEDQELTDQLTQTLRDIVERQRARAGPVHFEPEAEPHGRDRVFNALDTDLSEWLNAHVSDVGPSFELLQGQPTAGPGQRAETFTIASASEGPSQMQRKESNASRRSRQRKNQ